MTVEELALERMLALEVLAAEHLEARTRAACIVLKDATSFEGALATLSAAVSESVLESRRITREEAAKHFETECGLTAVPSGADDTERGEKAAAWYAKAWTKALGESPDTWNLAVEQARETVSQKLGLAASFEVVQAWNDEHRLNGLAVGKDKITQHWHCKRDNSVCVHCEDLDGTEPDENGKFPGGPEGEPVGWPPLHWRCRCVVITGPKAAPEGESRMSTAVTTKTKRPDEIEIPEGLIVARAFEFKNFDEEKRTADFVASTGVVDAHDEIVDQSSWMLEDYLKNPVVLFAHESRELPIGKSIDIGILDGALRTRIQFATADMNPKAEQIFQMVKHKFLRAVSVGFIPKSYRYEMREGVEVWVWADCVLKEISVTPVPANPEALAKMKSFALQVRDAGARGRALRSANILRPQERAAEPNPPAASVEGSTPPKEEESVMTEAEKAALQEQLNKSHLAIAELKLEAKNAGEASTVAKGLLATAEETIKTLSTDKLALVEQTKTLTTDRDAQKLRAETAEGALIELEVEGIVGKTITPAEKPMFITLRKSNPELFKDMVAQRTPLNLDKAILAGTSKDADGVAQPVVPTTLEDVVAEAQKLGN
jgi:HK97 family phage prohead protease